MTTATAVQKRMYIDGKWCEADNGRTLGVINPATEEVIAEVAYGGRADARAGHRGGRPGHAGLDEADRLGPGQGPQEDRRPDARAGRRHRPHADDGAGQAARRGQGRSAALGRHLRVVRRGGQARLRPGDPQLGARASGTSRSSTPSAWSAAISPWNFPITLQARKIAPALAAGCTIVCKPASQTPLCLIQVFECLVEAGLPAGVANLVIGPAQEIGRRVPGEPDLSARSASPARPRSASN